MRLPGWSAEKAEKAKHAKALTDNVKMDIERREERGKPGRIWWGDHQPEQYLGIMFSPWVSHLVTMM